MNFAACLIRTTTAFKACAGANYEVGMYIQISRCGHMDARGDKTGRQAGAIPTVPNLG